MIHICILYKYLITFLDMRECAQAVNRNMFELVSDKDTKSKVFQNLDLNKLMKVLRQYLEHSPVDTKVAVLKWFNHLFNEAKEEVIVFCI